MNKLIGYFAGLVVAIGIAIAFPEIGFLGGFFLGLGLTTVGIMAGDWMDNA